MRECGTVIRQPVAADLRWTAQPIHARGPDVVSRRPLMRFHRPRGHVGFARAGGRNAALGDHGRQREQLILFPACRVTEFPS